MRMLCRPWRSPASDSNRFPGRAARSSNEVAASRRSSLSRAARSNPVKAFIRFPFCVFPGALVAITYRDICVTSNVNHSPEPTGLSLLRGKLRPSGRGCRARRAQLALTRRLLLLDVLTNDGSGGTAATSSEVAWRPQCPTPKLLSDAWVLLLANHAA